MAFKIFCFHRNKPLMVIFHLEDCPHSQGKTPSPPIKCQASFNPRLTIHPLPSRTKRTACNLDIVQDSFCTWLSNTPFQAPDSPFKHTVWLIVDPVCRVSQHSACVDWGWSESLMHFQDMHVSWISFNPSPAFMSPPQLWRRSLRRIRKFRG